MKKCELKRRGFLMVELITALAILSVVVILTAQWTVQTTRASMRLKLQQQAMTTAENVLEIVADMPWDDLHTEGARQRLRELLDEHQVGHVKVQVTDEEGPPPGKRIDVWVAVASIARDAPPVHVSIWRFVP